MDIAKARVKARYNRERSLANKVRKSSTILGLTMGALTLTIYGYSMYVIKQESVMQEIDDSTASK